MDDVLARAQADASKEWRRAIAGPRWAIGIRGLAAVALGVVILVWPGISLLALTLVFGAFALFYGVVTLGAVFSAPSWSTRLWLLLLAAIDIAAGVVVIVYPNLSALALLYAIGAWAIAIGVLTLFGPLWIPGMSGGDVAMLVLSGLVSILFGVVMFAKPGDGALVLLALIAAFSIVSGVMQISYAIAIGHPERILERAMKSRSKPAAGRTAGAHT
jgi:uncharacterized membrane protein HdeD (DUF308 family)